MKHAAELGSGAGKVGVKVSGLSFTAIPHQSNLFLNYLKDTRPLREYYPNAIESLSTAGAFAPQVLANYKTNREDLCDVLADMNGEIGASEATLRNIELLRDSETVAVLTGQQAGLFSGPLYTIYKALSAIKMAERLNASGTKAVPIFWVATEDHDFDEVSRTFFIGSSGELITTKYYPADYVSDSQVGNVILDEHIAGVIDDLFESLPHTEFSDDIRSLLSSSWRSGNGYGKAFMETLVGLLENYGLIFFDPTTDRVKQLASPLFVAAIKHSDEIVKGIREHNADLKNKGFHAQVMVENDYFPLFWIDDSRRRTAIKKIGDGLYRIKGGKQEFTADELLQFAASEPTRFSPGVMLRPVVQDYLFPTLCYFGGGAEIAYFAQNSAVYQVLERPVTPILHRQSFTIVEASHQRSLAKLDLSFTDLFEGRDALGLRLAENVFDPDIARLFADVEERVNLEFNRLDQSVSKIDATVAESLARRRRKVVYHIAALRRKTLQALTRKDEVFTRRLDGLFSSLLPNGELQERSLNIFSYLNKFGPSFVDWIYEAIDLEDRGHRIVEL